jgi:predicted RNA methylase
MTRIVAKNGQREPVVTSAQPGVLYISGLPVEKNLFEGLRRKLNTISKAFAASYGLAGSVDVLNASCLSTDLPDNSVDYIFTDPPFGGNIPYGEVNFINEAWLGRLTAISKEITISAHQKKDINDYGIMMFKAFSEAGRLLKKDGMATVVFHSASAAVWNTFRIAYEKTGFNVTLASILDKTQGSFKQVTTLGAVRGDPMLLLTRNPKKELNAPMVWDVPHQAIRCDEHSLVTAQQLYSRLVTSCVVQRQDVPIDAITFYKGLSQSVEACGE